MRKHIPAILTFCIVFTLYGFMFIGGKPPVTDECAGYLICQNLEGSGYDNGPEVWVETVPNGICDEDYITEVLRGSQSLYMYSNGGAGTTFCQSPSFTPSSPVYIFCRFQYDQITNGSATRQFLRLRNSTPSDVARIDAVKNSSTEFRINARHNTAEGYGTTVYDIGTNYFIWVEYTKSTGANDGILKVFVDTDNTKPASPEIDLANGTSEDDIAYIRFSSEYDATQYPIKIFDQILVDDSPIGDVPS